MQGVVDNIISHLPPPPQKKKCRPTTAPRHLLREQRHCESCRLYSPGNFNNNNNNNNIVHFRFHIRYRDTTNVEPEIYDYTSNNWSHWNSNKKLKEKFGRYTRKTFDRFTTKDSYTWNITHNMESSAAWSLKPERWESPLVQEKYQEEKACNKRR